MSAKSRSGTRRRFTPEFKTGAVKLVLDEGKTVAQVSRDLELTRSALDKWVAQAKADRGHGRSGELTTAEKEELSLLRRRVRQDQRRPSSVLAPERSRKYKRPFRELQKQSEASAVLGLGWKPSTRGWLAFEKASRRKASPSSSSRSDARAQVLG
ncbi:MAG: transposase [Myxococcaceae bacterium]